MNTKKRNTAHSKARRDTSGISFYLRTGRLNPSVRGRRKLQQYLREIERDLIAMQGGVDHVTTAREILIKGTIEAFGVVLLAAMYCRRKGVLRPDRLKEGVLELQPVLGHQFLAFLNTIRQNLIALGLDSRKAEGILDLGRYLAEKKSAAGKLAEPLLVAGHPEIARPRGSEREISGDQEPAGGEGGMD